MLGCSLLSTHGLLFARVRGRAIAKAVANQQGTGGGTFRLVASKDEGNSQLQDRLRMQINDSKPTLA